MSTGFPPPNDPFLSAFTLLTQVYADGPVGVAINSPTDIAISPAIPVGVNSSLLVICSAIVIPGAGTSGLNLAIGWHRADGSGGNTTNLGPVAATPGIGTSCSRMWSTSPFGIAWPDATFRMAITQTGAPTAVGNAYGVGLAVFGRPY